MSDFSQISWNNSFTNSLEQVSDDDYLIEYDSLDESELIFNNFNPSPTKNIDGDQTNGFDDDLNNIFDEIMFNNDVNMLNNLESPNNVSLLQNISDDVLNTNNRLNRRNVGVEGDNHNTLIKHKISGNNNLLLGDIPEYSIEPVNNLSGEYNANIESLNTNELLVKNPFVKDTNVYKPKPRPVARNVNSYNNSNNLYGTVGNIGNKLFEGFQSNVEVDDVDESVNNNIVPANNINNVANNASFVNNNNNVANNASFVNNNNNVANNANNVANNNVANNVVSNNNVNNVAEVAYDVKYGLENDSCVNLYPENIDEYLVRASSERKVPGVDNNKPIASGKNMHSAQGYGGEGVPSGFNQYADDSINYLCV